MDKFNYGWGTGFAMIMALVLVVVIIYTIIKLRKQVRKSEDAERKKSAGNLNQDKKP